MADQIINTSALHTRTGLRANRTDWLRAWLDSEPLEPGVFEQQGFHMHLYYAVVIYRQPNEFISGAQFASILHTEAGRRGVNGPVTAHGAVAVLFHPVEDPRQTTRLKHKTEEIREQLSQRVQGEVCCGVGRPMRGMDNLRRSFRDAENAVRYSTELQIGTKSTFFGNSSLYELLITNSNKADLQRFCITWLADLISYDAQQNSDLVDTLKAYFANNGNTALTADKLKIHRNTLAYRLNRIAEITSLDLDDADVRLNLHLALKAHEVLGLSKSPQRHLQ